MSISELVWKLNYNDWPIECKNFFREKFVVQYDDKHTCWLRYIYTRSGIKVKDDIDKEIADYISDHGMNKVLSLVEMVNPTLYDLNCHECDNNIRTIVFMMTIHFHEDEFKKLKKKHDALISRVSTLEDVIIELKSNKRNVISSFINT